MLNSIHHILIPLYRERRKTFNHQNARYIFNTDCRGEILFGHSHPQPEGQSSFVVNHCRRCIACPPWPQLLQRETSPRQGDRQTEQLSTIDRHDKHKGPRGASLQLGQKMETLEMYLSQRRSSDISFITSVRFCKSFQRYRISAYDSRILDTLYCVGTSCQRFLKFLTKKLM